MIIGMILDLGEKNTFPPDIRVEKETRALFQEGHEIIILTRYLDETTPTSEFIEDSGTKVVRVRIDKGGIGKLGNAVRAFAMYDLRWKRAIERFIKEYNIQVLHVHDLFLLPTALHVARPAKIPVIADLHENIPAARRAYRSVFSPIKKAINSAINNYHLWRWHEARSLRNCDKIIVVVPEAAERIVNYGISEEKIVVVSNTEDKTTFRFKPEINSDIVEKYQKKWILSYVGGMGPHRGLDTAIQALPILKERISNVLLLIVGADQNSRKQIAKMTRQFNVGEHIEVLEWQPFEKVHTYIQVSDVCIVPHKNFEHTQTTVPHKLFQYMMCKKPVVVSSCRPLARIVRDSQSGLVFETENSDDFANKIVDLYKNSQRLNTLGMNGYIAATGQYAWHHDAKRLTDLYKSLLNS